MMLRTIWEFGEQNVEFVQHIIWFFLCHEAENTYNIPSSKASSRRMV